MHFATTETANARRGSFSPLHQFWDVTFLSADAVAAAIASKLKFCLRCWFKLQIIIKGKENAILAVVREIKVCVPSDLWLILQSCFPSSVPPSHSRHRDASSGLSFFSECTSLKKGIFIDAGRGEKRSRHLFFTSNYFFSRQSANPVGEKRGRIEKRTNFGLLWRSLWIAQNGSSCFPSNPFN